MGEYLFARMRYKYESVRVCWDKQGESIRQSESEKKKEPQPTPTTKVHTPNRLHTRYERKDNLRTRKQAPRDSANGVVGMSSSNTASEAKKGGSQGYEQATEKTPITPTI